MNGIDVSSNNHAGEPFNWLQVKEAGYEFVWVKATQGINYLNPYMIADCRDAMNNGLRVGVYHFYSATSGTPEEQAAWFQRNGIDQVAAYCELLPVLDYEQGAQTVLTIEQFIDALGPCGLYMNVDYLNHVGGIGSAKFLWLANPSNVTPTVNVKPTVVQVGQRVVTGIGGNPNGATALTDINTCDDITPCLIQQQPQPTTQGAEHMDSVVAPNGDIVSHYRTPDNHLLEVTRKAGTQGQNMNPEGQPENLSIQDITAKYPAYPVVG